MSHWPDYSRGGTMLNTGNLTRICDRAKLELDRVDRYHSPSTFYSSSSSSLPQTAGQRNLYLYSQERNINVDSNCTSSTASLDCVRSSSRTTSMTSASGFRMGNTKRPLQTRRNRGPDELFGDTNLGLAHSTMSFDTAPTLSKEGLEYSAPAPPPQSFRKRPPQPNAEDEVVVEERVPSSSPSQPLQRKPLNRSITESTVVDKRGHIGYEKLMTMAFENTQSKKQRLSKMVKPRQTTSYQEVVVNYAPKAGPPKLKKLPRSQPQPPVKKQPFSARDKGVSENTATSTCFDTSADDECVARSTEMEPRNRRYTLRRRTIKSDSDDTLLLKYQPAGCKMGVELTRSDVDTLKPGEFLNDKVMDFYLKYMMFEQLNADLQSKLHIFSSFFYTRLCNSSMDDKSLSMSADKQMHNRVKTWTRHVDLFTKDYIVIPICDRSHWYVLMVQNPGEFDHVAATASWRRMHKKRKGKPAAKRKSKRLKRQLPTVDLSGQSQEAATEAGWTYNAVGSDSKSQQGVPVVPEVQGDREVPGLLPMGVEGRDPLHVRVYEEDEEEEVDVTEDVTAGKDSPVPSASSASSYASCHSVLPYPDEQQQCDPGISMWEGLSGPPTQPSAYCMSTTPPVVDSSRLPLESVSSSNSSDIVFQGSRQPWVSVDSEEGSWTEEGQAPPLPQATYDLTAMDSDADSISRTLTEDSDEIIDESDSTDTDGTQSVKVKSEEDNSCLEPCIMVLDSLGIRRPTAVRRVRKYLSQEWVVKKDRTVEDRTVEDKFEHLRVHYPKIPLQHNSSDCGVYVLQFVEILVQCLNASTPLPSSTSEWGTSRVVNKRTELSQLIFNLARNSSSPHKNQC